MAKPMPTEPFDPATVRIAELIPITSPAALNIGPPELPCREVVAIEIEHRDDRTIAHDRHDDLRARAGVARDVARELLDIRHDHRALLGGGGAARALAELDPHAGDVALERAEHELALARDVEADPARARDADLERRRDIREVCDEVGLALDEARELRQELGVARRFIGARELEIGRAHV